MPKLSVFIRTSFIAFHHWPDAPIRSYFLKDVHRHVFHIEMRWPVTHTDRDIEFITRKEDVDAYNEDVFNRLNLGALSCEDIAKQLAEEFNCPYVMVSEDGENGAIYEA